MLAKRIIPCLDVKDGRTVKGINFVGLRDAGDPVEMGKAYSEQMADELVYLDITASAEGRKTFTEMVRKVAVNSAALRNPSLIDDIVKHFGSQICVLAIDAKYENNKWQCYLNGGRVPTERELFEWAKEGYERGVGEILFTSMNHDGTKTGFANDALSTLNNIVGIPIIASGGAGDKESFRDAFSKGHADAALAASVFHYGEIKIPELKEYLHGEGIEVRL